MKKPLLFIILILSSTTFSHSKELGIMAGYYGENNIHPGFYLGVEKKINTFGKFDTMFDARVGYAEFLPMYKTVFLEAELGLRFNLPLGFFTGAYIGLGYRHTFAGTEVYSVIDNELVRQANTGLPLIAFSASIGLGMDLAELTELPLQIYARYGLFNEAPFNAMMLFHPGWIAGLTYTVQIGGEYETE